MDESTASAELPRGAKLAQSERISDKSLELAADLARRGASESLVRAMGGDEAVKLYFRGKKSS
jgi:hypothetical protein